jgi:lysosomal alpha-mannosidase
MGFDGLFFARDDYQDKDTRTKAKTLEMVWKASANLGLESALTKKKIEKCIDVLGTQSWLFTNILYHHYDAPIDYTGIRVSQVFLQFYT